MDRAKQGTKRSTVVDADGILLGAVAAPANRLDSPLLAETLDTTEKLGQRAVQSSREVRNGTQVRREGRMSEQVSRSPIRVPGE